MKKYLYLLICSFIIANAQAQQSLTLYQMQSVPQAMYVNPGSMPSFSKINIGLPVLSSTYLNLSNSGFKLHDLITKDPNNGGLLIDADNFVNKLKANNYMNFNIHLDLLSVGFRIKKRNYVSFNVTEKMDVRFRYPKDFFSFLVYGNGASQNLGRDMAFNFGLDATHYREWGFNYTREVIEDKLTVGGRVKLLSGLQNINTKKTDITLNTSDQYYQLTAKSDIEINTAGFDSAGTSTKNLGWNPARKNRGVGIDLGATYKLNKRFSFTGSMIDLGFINWKASTTNFVSKNPGAQITYSGVDLQAAFGDSANLTKTFTDFGDSLAESFAIEERHSSYKTKLATQIYLGGNFWLNEKNNVGALFHGQFYDKKFHPALSLSITTEVLKFLNATLSYSMLNRSYNNIGFGLALKGGPTQIYIVSDNILSVLVYDKYKTGEGSAFKFPAYSKNFNVRIGINITIGKVKEDKDKDGVNDSKDKCPDVAGLLIFDGCPDKDGDKIPDKDDACPDVAGLQNFKGCPDTDGDGIQDSEDECDSIAGPLYAKGCPDTDNDSIRDIDDLCPQDSGLVALQGCPDKDGDGIKDAEDLCPDKAGPKENNGCPDTDKDGVYDHMDLCPDVAGPKDKNGCPDKDNDGVYDQLDLCPDKAGPADNSGCPVVKVHLVDKDGKIIATAVKGANGAFTFETLPPDNVALFKYEGLDTELPSDLVIVFSGSNKLAQKGADGLYHFPVVAAADKMKEEPVKAVQLEKHEEEIIKKAFDNLEFATGKDVIKPESLPALAGLADLLVKKQTWKLQVSGHTDNQGSAAANMALSKKRSMAVKKYLVSKGVVTSHITTKWYGATQPLTSNDTPEGREHNRRVEMLIIE